MNQNENRFYRERAPEPEWVPFTDRLSDALGIAAVDRSEADHLEALLKVTLSEMVNAIGGPIARAEHEARGSEAYRQLTENACAARMRANISAAVVKGMEYKFEAWRTAESTRRAEIHLK
jgi:hypothetical protein